MQALNVRTTYTIPMTKERLQQMIAAIDNAGENMLQGQDLYIQVSHNVDFKVSDLRPFSSSTAVYRESTPKDLLPA